MRRPPHDFREHFRRVIERAVRNTDNSMRFMRDTLDFGDFMSNDSPNCGTPRDLTLAFMVKYFSVYLYPTLAQALYLAVVQYCAEVSSRWTVSESDVQAMLDLAAIEYKTERELSNWIDAHFPHLE